MKIRKPVPDPTARAAGLETGEFDLIENMSINSIPRIESKPGLRVVSSPSFRPFILHLSHLEKHPSPVHDKRVRKALNYAIDKESIVKNLFLGKANVLQGQLFFPYERGFNPNLKPYPYDPEKAKRLLSDAGYPNGFEVTFKFPVGAYAQDKEVCEAIAGMLGKVGVKCDMIPLEPGTFFKQLISLELGPISFSGMGAPPEPHFQVSTYRSDYRDSYYHNPDLDKLIDAGAREMDSMKREKIYQNIATLMHDEAVAVYLYQDMVSYGFTKRLKNWKPTGDQKIFLYGVTLEQ